MRALGRDWSSFQRPVTRDVLAGLGFGFARVSDWRGGAMGTDPAFALDWQQLKAAGLVRGAYWYLIPAGGPSAEQQAQAFVHEVQLAGLRSDDLLVADSEEDVPGADDFTLAFLDEAERLTGHPRRLLVTYTNGAAGSKLAKTAAAYPSLWFAWPPSSPGEEPGPAHWAPAGWADWLFWQNGITRQGDGEMTDADVFNGTAAELSAFVHGPSPEAGARTEEDPMLLNKGAGATTPMALPTGATKVRFFASQAAKIEVDLRDGKQMTELDLDFSSAHTVGVPKGAHAIVMHRVDAGDNDVSAVVAA